MFRDDENKKNALNVKIDQSLNASFSRSNNIDCWSRDISIRDTLQIVNLCVHENAEQILEQKYNFELEQKRSSTSMQVSSVQVLDTASFSESAVYVLFSYNSGMLKYALSLDFNKRNFLSDVQKCQEAFIFNEKCSGERTNGKTMRLSPRKSIRVMNIEKTQNFKAVQLRAASELLT